MADLKRPRRGAAATVSRKVESAELPVEVAKAAGSTAARARPATKAQQAKARIVARLKRLHPMD